jgi:hypothetical protein
MVTVRTVLGDLPAADLGHATNRVRNSQLVEDALVANPARLLARFPAFEAAMKETHG